MSNWLVIYRPPGVKSGHDVWARIEDVPSKATKADVLAALEVWPRWSQWAARVRVGGAVNVRKIRPADRWPAVEVVEWGTLAPVTKRISIEVGGDLYAAIARHAQAEGLSLAEYVRVALANTFGSGS